MSNFGVFLFLIGALVAFFIFCWGLYWAIIGFVRLLFRLFGVRRPIVTDLYIPRYGKLTERDKEYNAYVTRKAWVLFFYKEALRVRKREKKLAKRTS